MIADKIKRYVPHRTQSFDGCSVALEDRRAVDINPITPDARASSCAAPDEQHARP